MKPSAKTEEATVSAPADLGPAYQAHTLAQIVYRHLVLGTPPASVPGPPVGPAATSPWGWSWPAPPPGPFSAWR